MAEDSQSTSNVLANNTNLGNLSRGSSSNLGDTQLQRRHTFQASYRSKLLLELLNLVQQLVTGFLAKFSSLNFC